MIKKPWIFSVEIETSKLGSLRAKNADDTDIAGLSMKLLDETGTEITDPADELTAVQTIWDWEPTFDYTLRMAAFQLMDQNLASDLHLFRIMAPDVSVSSGGSYEFVQDINLRYIKSATQLMIQTNMFTDPAITRYNGTSHSGKSRVLLKHEAGLQTKVQFIHIVEVEVGV